MVRAPAFWPSEEGVEEQPNTASWEVHRGLCEMGGEREIPGEGHSDFRTFGGNETGLNETETLNKWGGKYCDLRGLILHCTKLHNTAIQCTKKLLVKMIMERAGCKHYQEQTKKCNGGHLPENQKLIAPFQLFIAKFFSRNNSL